MEPTDLVQRRPGTFQPGPDARRSTNGGMRKAIREFEEFLDAEHRHLGKLRPVFERLRALAMGEVVEVPIPGGEGETAIQLRADPAFMKLYLDRVLGPVRDVSDVRLEAMVKERLQAMMEEAEERRANATKAA